MNVLIVDENPEVRTLITRTLELLGCDVAQAESGYSALDLLKYRNPFDVIFVDSFLPYMNGLQLLKVIKMRFPDAAIFMMFGTPDERLEVLAKQNGALGCVLGYGGRERFQNALELAQTAQAYELSTAAWG